MFNSKDDNRPNPKQIYDVYIEYGYSDDMLNRFELQTSGNDYGIIYIYMIIINVCLAFLL